MALRTLKTQKQKYDRAYRKRNRAKLTQFARDHRAKNREKYAETARKYRARNRELVNERRSQKRLIGGLITAAAYDDLLKAQDGVCAICKTAREIRPSPGHKRRRSLCVDHDHQTLRVRGLLCSPCNTALGYFKDNIGSLRSAISYLLAKG